MSTDDIIISHPAGTRTLALRESYLAICEGDKCEAHLLNANERWYAYKLKSRQQARHVNRTAEANGEEGSADEGLWVFMSAQEWVADLLNQYDEKTIRNKLAKLVERGFLSRRSNPKKKWDRKPQWLFMRANVQAAVDDWADARLHPDIDPTAADSSENAVQDDSVNDTDTTRENARMQSGEVPNGDGQTPESKRENARSNTTGIFHRDLSQEKEVGELPLEGDPAASGHFYEGQSEGQEPHAADLPVPAAPVVEQQAPTPVTVEDWIGEGEGEEDRATDNEEVPAARDEIHELSMWNPDDVNARLDQICNKRWLTPYKAKGTGPTQPALITEVDGTGVDRATLATIISPEKLEELYAEVRRERSRLEAQARIDSSVRVMTAQHMLIQAAESYALRLENLKAEMDALRAAAGAEGDNEDRPWDDDGQIPATPTLSLVTPKAGRAWRVGDVVRYSGSRYTISEVGERQITIVDHEGYEVNVRTNNPDALRLIQAAGETIEGCA